MKELNGIYKKYAIECSQDVQALYLELEKTAAKNLQSKNMNHGDHFSVPLADGQLLDFKFFEESTEISMGSSLSFVNGSPEILIPRDEPAQNYGEKEQLVMKTLSASMKSTGCVIGKPLPEKFIESMRNLIPGEIVVFEEGMAYVCENNDNGKLLMRPVFTGNIENFSMDNFSEENAFVLSTYDQQSLTRFYTHNKKAITETIEFGCYKLDYARQQRELMEKELKKGTTTFSLGPIKLTARKALGKVTWRDDKGNVLSNNRINYLLGYLNTNPKEIKVIEEINNPVKLSNIEQLLLSVESASKDGKFWLVSRRFSDFLIEAENGSSIAVNSFTSDKNNYIATTFTFVKENDNVHIFQYNHEQNDLSKEPVNIREVSEEDFINYYHSLYTVKREMIFAERMEYLQSKAEKIDDIEAENIYCKATLGADLEMSKINLISAENISKENVTDLLRSYVKEKDEHQNKEGFHER